MRGRKGFAVPMMVFVTLLLVGVVAAAVLIFRPWPFSTDTAKYGRVALPNTAGDILTTPLDESTRTNESTLELEEGTVTVFYARGRFEGRETLNRRYSPETFGLTVTPADGGPPLQIEDRGVTVSTNEGLSETQTIGEIDVPETGDYVVRATSRTADDTGHITFGDEKLAATAERAKDVLLTPWAATYLALLAISGFVAFRRFRGSPVAASLGGGLNVLRDAASEGTGPDFERKVDEAMQKPYEEAQRAGLAADGTELPKGAAAPTAKQRAAAIEEANKAAIEYLDRQLEKGEINQEQYEAAKAGILGQS